MTQETWTKYKQIIEGGISKSENGRFAISRERLRRSHGLDDDSIKAMLKHNQDEECYIVTEEYGDYVFRKSGCLG